MPEVCTAGDSLSTGHDCTGATTLDVPGQSSVYANNILVARQGDSTVPHGIGAPSCSNHTAVVNVGSSSVFVGNNAVARIADSTDAGAMTTGSADVFAG